MATAMKRTITVKTPAIFDDAPTLTQAHFDRAKFRVDSAAATRSAWQAAVRADLSAKREPKRL